MSAQPYTISTTTELAPGDATLRIREALAEQGFDVPTENGHFNGWGLADPLFWAAGGLFVIPPAWRLATKPDSAGNLNSGPAP